MSRTRRQQYAAEQLRQRAFSGQLVDTGAHTPPPPQREAGSQWPDSEPPPHRTGEGQRPARGPQLHPTGEGQRPDRGPPPRSTGEGQRPDRGPQLHPKVNVWLSPPDQPERRQMWQCRSVDPQPAALSGRALTHRDGGQHAQTLPERLFDELAQRTGQADLDDTAPQRLLDELATRTGRAGLDRGQAETLLDPAQR
ncbi:C5a peptidase [Amphibalanus amphitrite]|uniref:C5a peptidase n=1 Tax=Amphibalanus amphitrite TaxID=1232801 RepID=A0A6A4VWU2_AMPAM|nr:C5a peptidase [Amphibalanus amphitrite]